MNALSSACLRILVFAAGLTVTFLPRKAELALGRALGSLIRFAGYRTVVSRENVRRCFPELDEIARVRLLKKNYGHFGILMLELLHLFSPFSGHYRGYVERHSRIEGLENWERARAKGRGAVFIASHLGNWELMVAMGALSGIPITMVTKHLKPEWLHRIAQRARESTGIEPIYEPRTLPAVLRALRAGKAVGFMMDQYAGPPIGIPVKFFGVEVGTLAAVGTLVSRTGTAVVPAVTRRDENGVMHVRIEPELEMGKFLPDEGQGDARKSDVRRTTELLARKVENWVRANPEQWLWTHRRFKNVVWPRELA